jgi:Rieske Fe-S protein
MDSSAQSDALAQGGDNPPHARRRFLQTLLGGGIIASVASFLYPVLKYLAPPPTLDLGANVSVAAKVGELKPGTGKIFRLGSRPGLLILDANGQYHAVSATCTHLSCTVQYREATRQIWCACHNGVYDLNGRNISGPPPRPLTLYEVKIRGDEIVVTQNRET